MNSACADIMHVFPGMQYADLKDMNWQQLDRWRTRAVALFRQVHGLE